MPMFAVPQCTRHARVPDPVEAVHRKHAVAHEEVAVNVAEVIAATQLLNDEVIRRLVDV